MLRAALTVIDVLRVATDGGARELLREWCWAKPRALPEALAEAVP